MGCSIVIPSYRGSGLTERCLDALFAAPPERPFEVIVVDDASGDGSGDRLRAYGHGVRVIERRENGGFAAACNDGAAAAGEETLVLLNNDTLPLPGWLDALVDHAEAHPMAAVVGSKLLYPDGTVQHAGVVFGQDGYARHIYAGFPGDHPAVERSRTFQAVTAACWLVPRGLFIDLGGFDTAYRNGMEDVDFCLRAREQGWEIHYCHRSALYHLESVTRGRGSREIRAGIRRFRSRWASRIRPDDLHYYIADGLLRIDYRDGEPLRLSAATELAVLERDPGDPVEAALADRSRQAARLLRDLVRLTARSAGVRHGPRPFDESDASAPDRGMAVGPDSSPREGDGGPPVGALDPDAVTARIEELELGIHELQAALSGRAPAGALPTPELDQRRRIHTLRAAVEGSIPTGALVLVVSRGEDDLVKLRGLRGWHFPRDRSGAYAGHHPAGSEEAIAHLEFLRARGADYLVIPADELWWLEHYEGFARHLDQRYARVAASGSACQIYHLHEGARAHAGIG